MILDDGDAGMRASALCAIKNALFNSKQDEKSLVMHEFGWIRLKGCVKITGRF